MSEFSLYVNQETVLSRLDPRTKLVASVALFVVAMSFNHPLYLLVLLLFQAYLVVASHSLPNIRRVRALLVLLFVFSVVLWSLFLKQGPRLFRFGPLRVHRDSLLYAVGMGIRLVSMVVTGTVFLSSTRIEEFVFALRKFGLPMSVAFAFSLSFRIVSQLMKVATTVKQAQQVRGLDVDAGGIFRRVRNHIPVLIPIFVFSMKSVDSLTRALETRGFGCTKKPTPYIIISPRARDYAVIVASVCLAAAAVLLRVHGFGEVVSRL